MRLLLFAVIFLAMGAALPTWAQWYYVGPDPTYNGQLVPIGEDAQLAPTPPPKETLCQNGVDDDKDIYVDCGDPDCHVYTGTLGGRCRAENDDSCSDGVDNDGDGHVDCNDSDCAGIQACGTPSPTFFPGYPYCPYSYGYWGWGACFENCADGVDNDQDGLIDCQDTNCFNYGQGPLNCPMQEGPWWGYALCTDGVDNDKDNLVDCAEEACRSAVICQTEQQCANSVDDDRDSSIDCADSDCRNAQECMGVSFRPATAMGRLTGGTSSALAAAAAASAVASVATAAASAQSGPEFLRSLLPFSAVHRRQPPWGRVVEAHSNTPVRGVLLSLVDGTGKVRATERSRHDGTFGFFVPPGTYRILAQRTGYQFPAPAPEIALFPGEIVYDGGWMNITEESVLTLVVVGQEFSHTALAQATERVRGIWTRVQVWQARLAMPLLLIGSGLAALSFWNSPSVLGAVLIGVYLSLLVLELLLARVARRAVGSVRDAVTRAGVGLAVVRLTDPFGRLVSTRVTLESGNFFLMSSPGHYRVEITHPNYQLYTKEHLRVYKYFFGVASIRAKLQPK